MVRPTSQAAPLTPGQSHYLESCGGCHGIQGKLLETRHPGAAWWLSANFSARAAGREYIRSAAECGIRQYGTDRMLAEVMNFVVFGLGGSSVPAAAKQYSPGEVGALRRRPLKNRQLAAMRATILEEASPRCGAGKAPDGPRHSGQLDSDSEAAQRITSDKEHHEKIHAWAILRIECCPCWCIYAGKVARRHARDQ